MNMCCDLLFKPYFGIFMRLNQAVNADSKRKKRSHKVDVDSGFSTLKNYKVVKAT